MYRTHQQSKSETFNSVNWIFVQILQAKLACLETGHDYNNNMISLLLLLNSAIDIQNPTKYLSFIKYSVETLLK